MTSAAGSDGDPCLEQERRTSAHSGWQRRVRGADMAKESGLGKGLGALFGSVAAEPDEFLTGGSVAAPSEVPIDLIDNDTGQPRKKFDDEKLEELAQSIRTHGVMQPLVVSPAENGRYRIIAGERRFRASKLAGLNMIPVVIRETTEDREALEMALIENIQREDLNPMEQAGALRRLVKDYGLRQEEVASRVGKSRSTVANLMRLLHLPESTQDLVASGKLSAGHARALLPLESEAAITSAVGWILRDDLTVRQTEELVKGLLAEENAKETAAPKEKPKRALPPEFRDAQEQLSERFDTKVRIVGGEDKGKITIAYFSKDQLNSIYELLRGTGGEEL